MAREFSKMNLSINQDADWRKLPPPAQHLYMTLWNHPSLSYCGVVDWRPGRIAALSDGWQSDEVQDAADCLEARLFVVIDHDSEELLIRSWVRFDGLMKQPRVAVSFANAYAATASNDIRGVIIHEAKKLRILEPELGGWTKQQVIDMLDLPSIDPRSRNLPSDPFGDGFPHRFGHGLAQTEDEVSPKVSGSVWGSRTTATATTTSLLSRKPTIADAIPDAERPEVDALCERLAKAVESNGVPKPEYGKSWLTAARLLIDKDGYTVQQIEWMIDWATSDEFWRANILSMPKLRQQFPQLKLKSGVAKPSKPKHDPDWALKL